MCAFEVRDPALRGTIIEKAYANGVVMLASGVNSIRFRPPLSVSREVITEGLEKIRTSVKQAVGR